MTGSASCAASADALEDDGMLDTDPIEQRIDAPYLIQSLSRLAQISTAVPLGPQTSTSWCSSRWRPTRCHRMRT